MPWTPKQFRDRHNQGLSMPQAKRAAAQASAMIRSGVPEGEAIATANKSARRPQPTDATEPDGTYHGKGVRGHGAKSRTGKTRGWSGK